MAADGGAARPKDLISLHGAAAQAVGRGCGADGRFCPWLGGFFRLPIRDLLLSTAPHRTSRGGSGIVTDALLTYLLAC